LNCNNGDYAQLQPKAKEGFWKNTGLKVKSLGPKMIKVLVYQKHKVRAHWLLLLSVWKTRTASLFLFFFYK